MQIWDAVPKPHAHKETPLSEFFNVEVVALSSYEENEELFKEQVQSATGALFSQRGRASVASSSFFQIMTDKQKGCGQL